MKMSESGITIVVLVITIIVTIILAGVSIASITNGGFFVQIDEEENRVESEQQKMNAVLQEQFEDWGI